MGTSFEKGAVSIAEWRLGGSPRRKDDSSLRDPRTSNPYEVVADRGVVGVAVGGAQVRGWLTEASASEPTRAAPRRKRAVGARINVRRVEVGGPLPHVPCEIELAPAPGAQDRRSNRRDVRDVGAVARAVRIIAVVNRILIGATRIHRSPWVRALLAPSGRRVLPFRIARKKPAVPDAKGEGLPPVH